MGHSAAVLTRTQVGLQRITLELRFRFAMEVTMKGRSISLPARLLAIRAGVLIIAISMLVLVAISPLALREIARLPGMNWMRLSNIGQTYGGVSALLTALALGGVVISLLYQARDVRTAREVAGRTFQHELLKMELEDPLYMEAIGAPWQTQIASDYDSLRKYNFVHMWVSYWAGRYMLHEMSETEVQSAAARELFNGRAGRDYWSAIRTTLLQSSKGKTLRFAKILDEEYHKAEAGGPPSGGISFASNTPTRGQGVGNENRLAQAGVAICIAAIGITIGRLAGRRS
jgi:hypothetical protein